MNRFGLLACEPSRETERSCIDLIVIFEDMLLFIPPSVCSQSLQNFMAFERVQSIPNSNTNNIFESLIKIIFFPHLIIFD